MLVGVTLHTILFEPIFCSPLVLFLSYVYILKLIIRADLFSSIIVYPSRPPSLMHPTFTHPIDL